ncbi:hypothetical protein LJC34_06130 [Oscillospiraceae bacterium OttesenSCG-928-G22]|nr:hypothetical protein [Oscillospiraceae bacterium OttesenSCG-928-G22]
MIRRYIQIVTAWLLVILLLGSMMGFAADEPQDEPSVPTEATLPEPEQTESPTDPPTPSELPEPSPPGDPTDAPPSPEASGSDIPDETPTEEPSSEPSAVETDPPLESPKPSEAPILPAMQEGSVDVVLPHDLSFDIVIFSHNNTGIVTSDPFIITNFGETAVNVSLYAARLTVADPELFSICSEGELPGTGSNIRMALTVAEQDAERRVALSETPSGVIYTYRLESGESGEFRFEGEANEFGDTPWIDTVVTVSLCYSVELEGGVASPPETPPLSEPSSDPPTIETPPAMTTDPTEVPAVTDPPEMEPTDSPEEPRKEPDEPDPMPEENDTENPAP